MATICRESKGLKLSQGFWCGLSAMMALNNGTYKNKGLCNTWSGDIEQGDMNGDGLGGVWHVR